MELTAIIKALHHCLKHRINDCIVLTDSQYVIGCGLQGWKRNKNLDLWEIFDKLLAITKSRKYNISFRHVKGHQSGSNLTQNAVWNNYVDKLAVKASQEI